MSFDHYDFESLSSVWLLDPLDWAYNMDQLDLREICPLHLLLQVEQQVIYTQIAIDLINYKFMIILI